MGGSARSSSRAEPLRVAAIVTEESLGRPDIDWRIVTPFTRARLEREPWGIFPYDHEGYYADEVFDADIIVLGKITPAGPEHEERYRDMLGLLRGHGAKIILDLDDDCLSDAWAQQLEESGLTGWRSPEELAEARSLTVLALNMVDAVTVSTPQLGRLVEDWTFHRARVIPNALDVGRFCDAIDAAAVEMGARAGYPSIVIGWAGSPRPERDIEPMAQAWGRIAEAYGERVLFLVGGHCPDSVYEHVPEARLGIGQWLPIPTYASYMAVDIGCCPLADTPFNRAKSPIKALEYGAAGAAVVASPVVYDRVITHEREGLLASSADDWYAALDRLIQSYMLREKVAGALRSKVLARHDIRRNWVDWRNAYELIARGSA